MSRIASITKSLLLSTALTSSFIIANTLEDVIYKKDGSVLRGTLIEQDFANGRYKIQLTGGSIFSVDKDDIEKISKEAPLANNGAQSGVNININNNPSINQNPQVGQGTAQTQAQAEIIDKPPHETRGTLYIGTMSHTVKSSTVFSDTEVTYTGINIGGQINANQHLGLYADINIGSLHEKEETDRFGNTTTYSGSSLADEEYTSAQVSAILSTNLYQGWQFFTGLGLYTENYSTDYDSLDTTGTNFQVGLGYSWQTLQVALRVNALNSSDYSDSVDSSVTGHLQIGFNF